MQTVRVRTQCDGRAEQRILFCYQATLPMTSIMFWVLVIVSKWQQELMVAAMFANLCFCNDVCSLCTQIKLHLFNRWQPNMVCCYCCTNAVVLSFEASSRPKCSLLTVVISSSSTHAMILQNHTYHKLYLFVFVDYFNVFSNSLQDERNKKVVVKLNSTAALAYGL